MTRDLADRFGAQPLYIVNGIRYRADSLRLDSIDATRINNVEVLKGPAAVTKYGDAARNGVIVITTKPAGAP